MDYGTSLLRSVLYIPASKPRALDKARSLNTDAIIFDLEDAVAPDEKVGARATLSDELATGGSDGKLRLVRVNALDSEWGRDDLAAASQMETDAVLLPKVNGAADIDAATRHTDLPIWCMIETPLGVLNATEIGAHENVAGFVLGTNDLVKDMRCATSDRAVLQTALQMVLLAARATGVACIDGVFNSFRDTDGLRDECLEGRALGMDGKSLIHPVQIDVANAVFAPTQDEIALATRQIEAHETSIAKGEAVAVVDGRIVEALHIETARATLARAQMIEERATFSS